MEHAIGAAGKRLVLSHLGRQTLRYNYDWCHIVSYHIGVILVPGAQKPETHIVSYHIGLILVPGAQKPETHYKWYKTNAKNNLGYLSLATMASTLGLEPVTSSLYVCHQARKKSELTKFSITKKIPFLY